MENADNSKSLIGMQLSIRLQYPGIGRNIPALPDWKPKIICEYRGTILRLILGFEAEEGDNPERSSGERR